MTSNNNCRACGSQDVVRFPGRWGSSSRWVQNATICNNCLDVQADSTR